MRALWLFGSRARGTARPDSDHDFAVELAPRKGDHDWALADFICLADDWKAELRAIVGTPVHLVALREDLDAPLDPRAGGKLLWKQTP